MTTLKEKVLKKRISDLEYTVKDLLATLRFIQKKATPGSTEYEMAQAALNKAEKNNCIC